MQRSWVGESSSSKKMSFFFAAIILSNLIPSESSGRVCKVLARIDEPLYAHHGKNMTSLTVLIQNLFDGVNDIYQKKTGPFIGAYSDVTFTVVKIEVKSTSSCVDCTENGIKLLENFEQEDFCEFCLAFLFTYM